MVAVKMSGDHIVQLVDAVAGKLGHHVLTGLVAAGKVQHKENVVAALPRPHAGIKQHIDARDDLFPGRSK